MVSKALGGMKEVLGSDVRGTEIERERGISWLSRGVGRHGGCCSCLV